MWDHVTGIALLFYSFYIIVLRIVFQATERAVKQIENK
jgi:hypothetical protein